VARPRRGPRAPVTGRADAALDEERVIARREPRRPGPEAPGPVAHLHGAERVRRGLPPWRRTGAHERGLVRPTSTTSILKWPVTSPRSMTPHRLPTGVQDASVNGVAVVRGVGTRARSRGGPCVDREVAAS